MELNYSVGGVSLENFSTYTEVDSGGDLTVYDYNVTFTTLRRDATAGVWYDHGVDYFTDYEVYFGWNISALEGGDASNRLAIRLIEFRDHGTQDWHSIYCEQVGSSDVLYTLVHHQRDNNINQFVRQTGNLNVGTEYWLNISKYSATYRIMVYDDEAMTSLVYDHTNAGTDISMDMVNVTIAHGFGDDPADWCTGYLKNLNLNMGTASEFMTSGTYYTTEVLSGLNNNTLCLLYNYTVPSGSTTVEFSNDNSTWRDHNGNVGSDTLVAGYESLDLRDLNYNLLYMRYNFTRGLAQETPRIYQIRVITTDVVSGVFGISGNLIGILILLPAILTLLVILVKRK